MEFGKAYDKIKQGAKIKLPEWEGYWKWVNNSIQMNLKNHFILDIRHAPDFNIIIESILRDDWEIDY